MTIGRTSGYCERALESACMAAEQFPVILITGPRQVGKTSILEKLREPELRYITLDDMNLRALARHDPPLFLQHHALYHYRDKDKREIDLLIAHDGCLYPLMQRDNSRKRWSVIIRQSPLG